MFTCCVIRSIAGESAEKGNENKTCMVSSKIKNRANTKGESGAI